MVDIHSLFGREDALRQLYEKTPIAYQSLNRHMEIVRVNQAWLDLLGYSDRREVLGSPLIDFIVPEQRKKFKQVFDSFLNEGGSGTLTFDMVRKDNSVVSVFYQAAVQYGEGGKVEKTHCLLRTSGDWSEQVVSLKNRGELYHQIFNSTSDALVMINDRDEVVKVNDTACQLYGYEREEFLGKDVKKLIHPDYHHIFQKFKRDLQESGEFSGKTIDVRKDGSTFHAEICGTALEVGGKVHLLASIRDITERVIKSDILSFQETLWDSLMENTPDLVYFKDKDHRMIRASQAYADIFGVETKELVGKTADDLWPHEAEEILADERKVLSGKPIYRKHREVTTPEGKRVWYSLTKVPIYDGDEVSGFFAIDKDITERMEAEQELRESEQRFRTMYVASGVGIAQVSLGFQIEAANQKYCQIIGYDEEELIGKSLADITHPEDLEKNLAQQEKLRQGEIDSYQMEKRLVRKGGEPVWVQLQAHVVRKEDGTPEYFLGEIIDISERKRAEQQRKETIRELEVINDTIVTASRIEDIDEIMEHVADTIHLVNPGAFVTVSLFDERLDAIRVRAVRGIGDRLNRIFDLLGGDLSSLTLPADKMDEKDGISSLYTTGKLEKIPGGIYDLTLGTMPKAACRAVESLLGVKEVYTVGFARGDQPQGGIILLLPEGVGINFQHAIETIASHISVMVARRKAQKEIQTTTQQLQAVHDVGLQIASELEFEELLAQIVTEAVELVGGEAGGLNLFRQDQNVLDLAVSEGFRSLPEDTTVRRGEGLVGHVWQTGDSLIVNDYLSWENAQRSWADHFGHASDVGVPVYRGDEFLGVLEVLSYSPDAFQRSDIEFLERFATQAAIAIHNARIYHEAQQRRQEAETLRNLGMVINSSMGETQVFEKILEGLSQVISHDTSSIKILRNGTLITEAVRGFSKPELEIGRIFDPKRDKLSSKILRSGKGLIVDDVQEEENWEGIRGPDQVRAWLGVPLKIKGEIIGLLTIDHHQTGHFTEHDMELATAFANQAAIALRNADLFREKNKQATQMSLVNQVSQEALTQVDLDDLFWKAAEAIQDAFGYSDVLIYLVNQEEQTILRKAYAGEYERDLENEKAQPITDEGIINWVAVHGETVVLNNVEKDERYEDFFEETKSELCVPLKENGQIIGGINVESSTLNAFDRSDVLSMETLADNLAAGIRTARLHEETERRAEEFSALYDSSLSIAQKLDFDHILEGIREQIEFLFHPDIFLVAWLKPGDTSVTISYASERGKRLSNMEGIQVSVDDKEGLISWVMRTREPLLIEDVERETIPVLPRQRKRKSRTWMAVPMMIQGDVVGAISLQSYHPFAFSEEDLRLLELFTHQATVAIENARLFEEANRRLERLSSLREIDRAITGSLDLRTTLDVLLVQLIRLLDVDAASVLTYEKDLQSLKYEVGKGFRTEGFRGSNLRVGKGLPGQVAIERRPVHITNLKTQTANLARQRAYRKEGFLGYHGIPLIAKGEIVGVLEVFQRKPLHVSPEWLGYVETVAGQAAIAIDRLNLFYQLEKSNVELAQAYDAVIEGWSHALELRDKETEGHSSRVQELTLELSRRLGVPDEDLAHVRRGALLHDIGKMGVPDQILQKEGKLTDEEWEIMKQHPKFAYDLLSSLDRLRPALDIPYCHHERWDGTGYPRGLEGENIPLAARIFAVVDVWDALRSDRPYRDAWSDENALQYIREQAGKHFDPRVVEEFLSLIEDK